MGYKDRALDNPINWSFRAGRLFGIDIRIHILFVLCAVVMIWMELPDEDAATAPSLGSVLIDALGIYAILFFIVLVHEFGHCFGARFVGGEADEILLWPLGGLAFANPPHNARAHMITTVAGPAVNVIFCAICSAVLAVWFGTLGAVPWNPLHPMTPVDRSLLLNASSAQIWVMRFYGVSYFLLLINLLPVFPFDGGRIVQAWLWPRKGYHESMLIATSTGMIGAVLIGLFGLFLEESWLLLMIAVMGYLTCWRSRRMLRETGDVGGELGYDFSQGYTSLDRDDIRERRPGLLERRRMRKAAQKAEREHKRREEHQRAVEKTLRKISESGVESLTPSERRILEEETERQRTANGHSDESIRS